MAIWFRTIISMYFLSRKVDFTWVQRSHNWQFVGFTHERQSVNVNYWAICDDVVGVLLKDNGNSRPGHVVRWKRMLYGADMHKVKADSGEVKKGKARLEEIDDNSMEDERGGHSRTS